MLDIDLNEYPYRLPKVKFITKVYHPNIDDKGNISLDILGMEWSLGLKNF